MKPAFKWIGAASLVAVLLAFGSPAWAQGAAPAAAGQATPGYTTAEYNAYMAAKGMPSRNSRGSKNGRKYETAKSSSIG